MTDSLKYDIPRNKKIITGPLAIIPEPPERFPIGVTPIMGLPAGIGFVRVIVTDVFNLFEV
jgi:hypothetical protein